MLRGPHVQQELKTVFIEQLVPADHLLRKIAAVLDTTQIREETAKLYSERGRPAIDGRSAELYRKSKSTWPTAGF